VQLETADAAGRAAQAVLDLRSFPSDAVEGDVMERVGLRLYRPPLEPIFGKLIAGGPAQRAGLAEGDRILRVNAEPLASWEALVAAVRAHPGATLRLSIQRGEQSFAVDVVPDTVNSAEGRIGRIGAGPLVPASQADMMVVRVQYAPLTSLGKAVAKTWDISTFSLKMLGKMLIGEVSWKHLSGPVTIADFAGQSAQMGWISYLTFLSLISISLGVLNLLPIPLLDGGHLMYYAIELVKGRPVSERAMELGQRVGLALLLVMMAFAFYNDLNRLLTG
jgi:regulator of sigma E protease